MSALRERVEQRLGERIACELKTAGGCKDRPAEVDTGPLFRHLDEVISIVAGVQDYSVDPYMERVREVVCSGCRQKPDGGCTTREDGRCALERFFPIIVAVIEQELREESP